MITNEGGESFEEIDESVAEQAERRAKVSNVLCLFCFFGLVGFFVLPVARFCILIFYHHTPRNALSVRPLVGDVF